jgi:hypothetical protein
MDINWRCRQTARTRAVFACANLLVIAFDYVVLPACWRRVCEPQEREQVYSCNTFCDVCLLQGSGLCSAELLHVLQVRVKYGDDLETHQAKHMQ